MFNHTPYRCIVGRSNVEVKDLASRADMFGVLRGLEETRPRTRLNSFQRMVIGL